MRLYFFFLPSSIRYADSRQKHPYNQTRRKEIGGMRGILGTPSTASCIIHSRLDTANILSHVI